MKDKNKDRKLRNRRNSCIALTAALMMSFGTVVPAQELTARQGARVETIWENASLSVREAAEAAKEVKAAAAKAAGVTEDAAKESEAVAFEQKRTIRINLKKTKAENIFQTESEVVNVAGKTNTKKGRPLSYAQLATKTSVEDMIRRKKIAAVEWEELIRRRHSEALLKDSMMARYVVDRGPDVPENLEVYYVCINEMDYIAAKNGDDVKVYLACMTKKGEYFVSSEDLMDEVVKTVSANLTTENLVSSVDFWHKITLMDKPEGMIDQNSLRPIDENGVMIVPYYNQGRGFLENGVWTHTEWPNVTFNVNGHTMHEAGCGYFSTAMALSYVKQEMIAPIDFKENGQYISGQGSAPTVGVYTARQYDVPAYLTGDWATVYAALINGHPVMEHVGPSVFTKAGHYIVLVGVLPDGTIAVNDPGHVDNSYWYNHISFPVSTILGAQKGGSSAFTVFG